MLFTAATVLRLIFASANCDAQDPSTGLSVCETRDIEQRSQVHRDSLSRSNKTEIEIEYAAVCVLECFPRHLACGKRKPSDRHYACMVEADSDATVGSDASNGKEGN